MLNRIIYRSQDTCLIKINITWDKSLNYYIINTRISLHCPHKHPFSLETIPSLALEIDSILFYHLSSSQHILFTHDPCILQVHLSCSL